MRFTGTLAAPRLDINAYRERLHKEMANVLAQAVMTWLSAVVDQIPVWSGASRATFIPLGQKISYGISISPVTNDRIGVGQAAGQGDVKMDTDAGHYYFEYSTSLPWLVWNEYHNANIDPDPTKWPPPSKLLKPGPYQFQKIGEMAFREFAKQVTLPGGVSQCIRSGSRIKLG